MYSALGTTFSNAPGLLTSNKIMKKTKAQKIADAFDIEAHIKSCDVSYRGGRLEVDVSDLFPEVSDWDNGDTAIMGASQNYLGGGIAGSIDTGAMFDRSRLSRAQQDVYIAMAERCKRYFYSLNEGGGDEYMHDNVTGPEAGGLAATQRMPRSAY